jgi:hypothetical protein
MRKIIIGALAVITSAGLSMGAALPASGASTAAGQKAALTSATACGVWRWPVKTGSDADRYRVSRTVVYTTIRYLRARTAPSSFSCGCGRDLQ